MRLFWKAALVATFTISVVDFILAASPSVMYAVDPVDYGRYSSNAEAVVVRIPDGAQGVYIGRYTTLRAAGGALGPLGHLIGNMNQVDVLNYSHQPLTVGSESQLSNNGRLDNAYGFTSHIISNFGRIGFYAAYNDGIDMTSGGSYDKTVTYNCADFTPIHGVKVARCLSNDDPNRPIESRAPFIARGEVASVSLKPSSVPGTGASISVDGKSGADLTIEASSNGNVVIRRPQIKPISIAQLPKCDHNANGLRQSVTDALAPTFLGTLHAGGNINAPAYCNGTDWVAE